MAIEIIAEVGECFNGCLETAFNMIAEAAKSGCDTVKFQILDMKELSKSDPEYEWFKKITLSKDDIEKLIICAEDNGVACLFTPVSIDTAQMMVDLGCKRVKIASSFIGKKDLIDFIEKHFDEVIVSTGMADLKQVNDVFHKFSSTMKVSILHCVSEYPTGPLLEMRGLQALNEDDVHLQMMSILTNLFPNIDIGYSDHTDGILAPVVAAAMGAKIIEKHFTLDRKTPIDNYYNKGCYMGTDHVLSLEPEELKTMVELIRRTERIRGDYSWQRSPGEKILLDFLTNRYKER